MKIPMFASIRAIGVTAPDIGLRCFMARRSDGTTGWVVENDDKDLTVSISERQWVWLQAQYFKEALSLTNDERKEVRILPPLKSKRSSVIKRAFSAMRRRAA